MPISEKLFKRKIIILITLIFDITVGIFAASDFAIKNLSIVDETNLNQFTSYAPQFAWRYSHPAEDYLLKLRLYASNSNRDSLVWESGLMTTRDSSFTFSGLGVFEKGRPYNFCIAAKHPQLGWSDSLQIGFTINTPPTTPEIHLPADTIFLEKTIALNVNPATDRQIRSEDLFYQAILSNDSTRQIVVLDTTFQLHDGPADQFITARDLKDNLQYYISIRASDGVEYSNWSPAAGFLVNRINEPPRRFKLTAPADKISVNAPPTLIWEKSGDPDDGLGTGIKEYLLEIATQSDFRDLDTCVVLPYTVSKWTFENCQNHRHYFWRVIARDEMGVLRPSDHLFSFVTNFGNLPPESPFDPRPIRAQFIQPTDYLEWTFGNDPDGDMSFSCEITIWDIAEPDRQMTVLLSDSLLEQARDGIVDGLSYKNDRSVRFRLNRINDTQFLQDNQIYGWRLKINDRWGGSIETDWDETTFHFDDGINQPPLSPMEGFNPNGIVIATHTPELSWAPASDPDVADRLRYEIILIRDRGFSGRTYISEETTYDQNQIKIRTPLLENRQYFWRVRSIDLAGVKSAWSKINTFWVNEINEAPQRPIRTIHPRNFDEINPKSHFWWLPSDDPDPGDQLTYQIECSETPNFEVPLFTYRVEKTRLVQDFEKERPLPPKAIGISIYDIPQINLLKDNTLYYWRIRAFDPSGLSGMSASRPIRVAFNYQNDPPLRVNGGFSPANDVIIRTLRPEIRWEASSDPDFRDYQRNMTYQIKISSDSQFPEDATRIYTTAPGQTAYTIPADLTENDRWFYRVRACDQHGSFSPWSALSTFITDAISEPPHPITAGFLPKDSMVVETTRPLISWLPAGDPDPGQEERDLYYLIRYYEADHNKKGGQVASKPGATSTHLPELKEDLYYYYQIAAVDPDGNRSEWSPAICFGVNAIEQAPDFFQLISPFYGQDSVAMNAGFIWRAARDKDPGGRLIYTLFYATDSLFSNESYEIVLEQSVNDSIIAYYPPGQLRYATRYFWKVLVADNSGNQRWGSETNRRPFVFSTIGTRLLPYNQSQHCHLYQNYPNPFNIDTMIKYEVPVYETVDITIYDLIGMKIKTLASGSHTGGTYNVYWDGTDQGGSIVANGVYICRLTAPGSTTHIKVVLMR